MTVSLPIVERELRIAARKWGMFWVRVIAAFTGIVIAGGMLTLSIIASEMGAPASQFGRVSFGILTWMCLAAALAAGVFFTSDCLSEEKREGTLGFLFLTDLRGYDVVLGKLFVTSLRGLFGLLAVFPVLAVTFIMGGVTGVEFWKTILALTNAMVVSLSVGMFVSAISRDSQRALIGTVVLMSLLVFAGPVLDGVLAGARGKSFLPFFALGSPGFVFMAAGNFAPEDYWAGLLVTQIIAWVCLAASCLLVTRTWQEKKSVNRSGGYGWSYALKFGGTKTRERLRRKLVFPNPVVWLVCRERWQSFLVWTLALAAVISAVWTIVSTSEGMFDFSRIFVSYALTLFFYLWVASQSCRFMIESRKSGLIELILSSPLDEHRVVQGQWSGLKRMFALPVALFLVSQLAATLFMQLSANTNAFAMIKGALSGQVLTVITTVLGTLVVVANLVALAWVGMWMGITSRNASFATLKTLLFVQIVPWIATQFISAVGISLLMMVFVYRNKNNLSAMGQWLGTWTLALYTLVPLVLALVKDVVFATWARKKLYSSFRERATRAVLPVRISSAPPLPAKPIKP